MKVTLELCLRLALVNFHSKSLFLMRFKQSSRIQHLKSDAVFCERNEDSAKRPLNQFAGTPFNGMKIDMKKADPKKKNSRNSFLEILNHKLFHTRWMKAVSVLASIVELRKPRDSRVVPYSFSDEQKILVC